MILSRRVAFIFLLILGIVTIPINSLNAKYFGLQNAVIEGLVTHRTFSLVDQVIPGFNLVEGDETYRYGEKVFPMKQPGQAILGAIVYLPLKIAGFDWVHHYDYASNLVTMLTSGVLMAVVASAMYMVTKNYLASCLILATIMLPYAGVSHHDVYATAFSFLALTMLYFKKYLWAGVLSGITILFSMLPMTMPIGLLIAIYLEKRDIGSVKQYLVGLFFGLLPSLVFNLVNFGNPLLFPNLAGKVKDTIPIFDLKNLFSHLYFYLIDPRSSLWAFSPVLLFSVYGYKSLKKLSVATAYASIIVPTLLLIHISLQETYGGYQYGPRYLLPIVPYLALLTSYAFTRLKKTGRVFFTLAFIYSLFVAVVGALTTVMYPMPNTPYAPFAQLSMILQNELPVYRLALPGAVLAILGLFLVGSSPRKE